jgi:hypothetical protein
MRLTVDHSAGAHNVQIQCYVCKAMLGLCDALIDLDGPAFEAYYHKACLPPGETLPPHEPPKCQGPWHCVWPIGGHVR